MAHVYEVGYGTHEESEFSQIVHRRKFSQSRFEKMVLSCVAEAAKMECELHIRQWGEHGGECHEFEKESYPAWDETYPWRKYYLELALKERLSGNEKGYNKFLEDACVPGLPGLSYQDLHSLVVWLMCKNYGFTPLVKLRKVCFSGWDHLDRVHGRYDKSITARASRLVRKFLKNFGRPSAELEWSTIRKRVLRENPAGGDIEDGALCQELGLEFVPYNHPEAVKARKDMLDKKSKDLPLLDIDDIFGLEQFGI